MPCTEHSRYGLVHSRLDYCNVVFAGLPACDVQRQQSVLNTAVRLVAGSSRRDHVTSLLCDRHWLPVEQRVEYKLCSLSVRRRTILFSRSHHPVCCCKCQSRSEICRVDDRRNATQALIIWRQLFCDGRPACVAQATVTPPSSAVC